MDVTGEGAAQADVVIEAIYENLDAKRALYARLEPLLKPTALLATNTSSIKIEALAEKLNDPGRLVGIHFFNPVAQMQLVEIVQGAGTRAQAVQSAVQLTRRLDKLPLPCRSAPGFVVNRILMPYINEALFALADGIPAAVIDRAGTRFGMPVGPIELADVVGLDVALHVGRVLAEAFHGSVPPVLVKLVEQKKFGRKSGEGFYVWRDGKPVRPAPQHLDMPPDLEDRLILPMLNEAVAALREGVVEDADLLDAGAIFRHRLRAVSRRPPAICEIARRREHHFAPHGARAALWRALSPGWRMEPAVIHCVVGTGPACVSIRSQNHGVVTKGAGELLDG